MQTLWQDLRYGVRMLVKKPGFTLIAVLTLALSIGANTAIFSLIDAVLLKTLPVKKPEQLVLLSRNDPQASKLSSNISYPIFERLRDHNPVCSGMFTVLDFVRLNVIVNGRTEMVEGQLVSGGFHSVLGIEAILGRTLNADDDQVPGGHPVAVISYGYWQRRFARDSAVVGKIIGLNGAPFTIIGVTPPEFFGVTVGISPDISVPLVMLAQIIPGETSPAESYRHDSLPHILARLNLGVTAQQASAALTVLLQQSLGAEAGSQWSAEKQQEFRQQRIELTPASQGLSGLRRQFYEPLRLLSAPLGMLMAGVGLVLLIACANVANLLLARAAARCKEIAVRLALGAGRWRLVRQLLTESLLLALLGGGLGLFFAGWGTQALLSYLPQNRGLSLDVRPDARVLLFTLTISALTGVLFGLAPALRATRLDLTSSLKERADIEPGRLRFSLNKALVVAQVALSLFLLIGAGLFVRTLQNLRKLDTGFDRENLTQFWIDSGSGEENSRYRALFNQIRERLESLPGVRSATMSSLNLLTGDRSRNLVKIPGYTPSNAEEMACHELMVGPRFFETLGMTLLQGRDFGPQDERPPVAPTSEQPNQNVQPPLQAVIINQTMARAFFGNESPVGKTFSYPDLRYKGATFQIIGVVSDAKYDNLREQPPKTFYKFFGQALSTPGGNRAFQLRTAGNPAELAVAIKRAVSEINPKLQILDLRTMNDIAAEAMTQERFVAQLASFFSLFALLLSCIGLYGVMSYTVTRRTNEIGIRIALGARAGDIVRLVLGETMLLVTLGVAIGLGAAVASTRLITNLLYGLAPNDPLTMAAASLLLLAVAALAGYLPARRATKVDPLTVLRHE